MKYVEWIKESKTYTCPKAGVYKIICVGGGASGGIIGSNGKMIGFAGSATSFGGILSADGGTVTTNSIAAIAGGQSGYDGVNYASSPLLATTDSNCLIAIGGNSVAGIETGHGYGAGGGASGSTIQYKVGGTSNFINMLPASGRCGKMESTIVDLNEGQIVACTIGNGGTVELTDDDIKSFMDAGTSIILETTSETVKSGTKSGADGLIIVQYLGENM